MAQTGVQVLFGFLLTVPFTSRFGTLGSGQRALYFATLLSAGAAAMLLITPSSHHRVLFQCGDKPYIVRMANRYAIAGLACVALAMVGALSFVADVILGGPVAATIAATATGVALWCWYLQPLRRRSRLHVRGEARPVTTLGASRTCRLDMTTRPRAGNGSAMDERSEQLERFKHAVDRKAAAAEAASHHQSPAGEQPDAIQGDQASLHEHGRVQDVLSVREKNSGHDKKTADKWNQ